MNAILTCLQSSHDPALLALAALAALVCALGVYGSSSVARHAGRVDGTARRRWAAVGIVAAGCTAWATHMVALLAFQPGMQSGFDPWMTALSLLLAVAGIGAGLLVVVGRRDASRRFAGGVVIGTGVALLHYVGQAAYVVRGVAQWNHELVAMSLLVGLPLFGLSLAVSGVRNRSMRAAGAPLLLLSIAVLHLGGMAALQLEFDPRIELPSSAVSPDVLAPAVAIICFGLLCVAVIGLRLTLHAKAVLRRERLRLGELANLALEGLAICDGDRILTVNDSLATLCGMAPAEFVGRSLRSLVPGRDLLALPEREEADADVVTPAGKLLPVRVLRSEVRLGGRPQAIIAFRDQRERLRSEERIAGLPAHALELEVTENVVLQSERTTASHLKRLRAMGVGIAFDDFGTGYASLTMLKQLDVTRLKIDRSFVREIETNRKDQAIVDAVIRMAEGCDLAVIAEGIETKAQADYLRGRLPEGQGYLFGKPMTAGSFSLFFVEPAEPIRRTG
ncbi:EAL domain-containing protein [Aureimonas pseudogalii]|uniref:NO-binding membrane sensor protein with MHYT domain n=1 Tax=Aureimonas pseudogalii TaxID=1744844 RepID=A0A7W6MK81_9HYPH|nr:EAL domain-containing protein [Aureimonas pseudogalii]MBB3998864.1 NO-binding membrane sensor protein with MHYT domain [Aureimonas pseudogalii]